MGDKFFSGISLWPYKYISSYIDDTQSSIFIFIFQCTRWSEPYIHTQIYNLLDTLTLSCLMISLNVNSARTHIYIYIYIRRVPTNTTFFFLLWFLFPLHSTQNYTMYINIYIYHRLKETTSGPDGCVQVDQSCHMAHSFPLFQNFFSSAQFSTHLSYIIYLNKNTYTASEKKTFLIHTSEIWMEIQITNSPYRKNPLECKIYLIYFSASLSMNWTENWQIPNVTFIFPHDVFNNLTFSGMETLFFFFFS